MKKNIGKIYSPSGKFAERAKKIGQNHFTRHTICANTVYHRVWVAFTEGGSNEQYTRQVGPERYARIIKHLIVMRAHRQPDAFRILIVKPNRPTSY